MSEVSFRQRLVRFLWRLQRRLLKGEEVKRIHFVDRKKEQKPTLRCRLFGHEFKAGMAIYRFETDSGARETHGFKEVCVHCYQPSDGSWEDVAEFSWGPR